MSKNAFVPYWFKGWSEKYSPLLVEGLTDGPTYVRLVRKECPMLDVQMALRPFVMRFTEDKLAFCGKLSVFPVKSTIKAAPANDKIMAGWLSAAFPNIEFPKQNGSRVGTIVMTLSTAPINARKAFMAQWSESNLVDSMLSWIEQTLGIEVAERKIAARALKEAYTYWLDDAFLPDALEDAGVSAKVAVDTEIAHGENILPFVKKKMEDELAAGLPKE